MSTARLNDFEENGTLDDSLSYTSQDNRRLPKSYANQSLLAKSAKYIAMAAVILLIALAVVIMVIFLVRMRPKSDGKNHYKAKLMIGENGAVAADIPHCSVVGRDILQKEGGNAVDAAVATCLCIGVMGSYSSGIGGGGIMLISKPTNDGRDTEVETIDFREIAPLDAHRDMFNGMPTNYSQYGGKAIAVPGEIKGLYAAWNKYGSLPWATLVQPSIKLSREGYTVSRLVAQKLKTYADVILNEVYGPGMKEVYAPKGKILVEGETLKNEKLANTLQTIAEGGESAFYDVEKSQLARDIISDIQKAGGIVNGTDMKNYHVKFAPALSTYYHGYKVHGAQPEISGGACTMLILNLIERFGLSQYPVESFQVQHLIVEAMKFAFGHRMELGDPAFTQHLNTSRIVDAMLSKDYAAYLRQYLSVTQTNTTYQHYLPRLDDEIIPLKASVGNHGTAHLSVVDSNRMSVSLTSTINLYFGSFVLGEKTGILFNDQMDDFSVPGRTNFFNLPPSEANFIAPGKRPLSSMAPTIVTQDGKLKMSVGASGGPLITTSTVQTLLRVLDQKMPVHEAIQMPRFHHQLLPPRLDYEGAMNSALVAQMKKAGHVLNERDNLGNCQAIVSMEGGKVLHASSDPRKDATASVY